MARRRRAAEATEEEVAATIAPALHASNIESLNPNRLIPSPDNPRENEAAIQPVMNSIENFGFWMPIVVNDDDVIIAGHTRREAAIRLGMDLVPVLRVSHLSDQQQQAFRLIDNKVAEMADWDNDLLADNINRLTGDFDLTQFGWTQSQIDCLGEMVTEDCLGDMMTETTSSGDAATERTTPDRIRFVIGEIVIHIPADTYREWVVDLRADCDFVDARIEEEVLNRLRVTT